MLMALIIHIIIAVSSIIFAGVLLARPSKTKFSVNYGLVAATIASGTYLIVTTGTHMLSACASGLTYLGIVTVLLASDSRAETHQQLQYRFWY